MTRRALLPAPLAVTALMAGALAPVPARSDGAPTPALVRATAAKPVPTLAAIRRCQARERKLKGRRRVAQHRRCRALVARRRTAAERPLTITPGPTTNPDTTPTQVDPVTTSPGTTDPGPAGPATPAGPARLQVTAREFSLKLSRPSLGAGDAIVELANRGEDPHDLVVSAAGGAPFAFPQTLAGERTTRTLSLAAGTYTLVCSIEFHEDLGMRATLTVT